MAGDGSTDVVAAAVATAPDTAASTRATVGQALWARHKLLGLLLSYRLCLKLFHYTLICFVQFQVSFILNFFSE